MEDAIVMGIDFLLEKSTGTLLFQFRFSDVSYY